MLFTFKNCVFPILREKKCCSRKWCPPCRLASSAPTSVYGPEVQGIFGETFFFFGMTVLSSAVFHLQNRVSDFFAREIKSFYQISLGNEVDFWDIMNVSQISLLKIKILKN